VGTCPFDDHSAFGASAADWPLAVLGDDFYVDIMESLLLHSCTRTERFIRAMRPWLWLMRGERIKRRMRCGGTTVRRNRRQGVALVS